MTRGLGTTFERHPSSLPRTRNACRVDPSVVETGSCPTRSRPYLPPLRPGRMFSRLSTPPVPPCRGSSVRKHSRIVCVFDINRSRGSFHSTLFRPRLLVGIRRSPTLPALSGLPGRFGSPPQARTRTPTVFGVLIKMDVSLH